MTAAENSSTLSIPEAISALLRARVSRLIKRISYIQPGLPPKARMEIARGKLVRGQRDPRWNESANGHCPETSAEENEMSKLRFIALTNVVPNNCLENKMRKILVPRLAKRGSYLEGQREALHVNLPEHDVRRQPEVSTQK